MPRFPIPESTDPESLGEDAGRGGEVFALSSHERAREALAFGLSVAASGFNIFVLGADRSGRMSATLAYLQKAVAARPVPDDWVYLNNFTEPQRPKPYRLPAGDGRRLQTRLDDMIPRLREVLQSAFSSAAYETQVQEARDQAQSLVAEQIEALRQEVQKDGLDLVQLQGGITVVPVGPDGKPANPADIPEDRREGLEAAVKKANETLRKINRQAGELQVQMAEKLRELNRGIADRAVSGLMDAFADAFPGHRELGAWIDSFKDDVLANVRLFLAPPEAVAQAGGVSAMPDAQDRFLAQRYGANLLVDHGGSRHPMVELAASPTVSNLFGDMQYRQAAGVLETDFTLIRAGALHRANGGVLVVRAEALAADPRLWVGLKAALRDRQITIDAMSLRGGVPIAGALQPLPIPLDVKVVVVGAPQWYYTFFSLDSEFHTYFRIKADVDTDMPATPENIACYGKLVQQIASAECGRCCTSDAVAYILGLAARWTGDRTRLTAQFEMVEDTVQEAVLLTGASPAPDVQPALLTQKAVAEAVARRRDRNSRIEDRLYEQIADDTVMIDVSGSVRGQVNALTVRSYGDHSFGTPSRVTARASVGRKGVINVERDIALGGPIQQKGVMVLQGFLAGHFARAHPLSFNCSITFEQSYGGVEGDSASLAELVAILSEIANLPARQDLAITGSVNQRGQSQAVGGVHLKVEGFFRACQDKGELTGSQGVIIPKANEDNLVLHDEAAQAVRDGRFHVWSVTTVDEALSLFLGREAGHMGPDGNYPAESIYGRVAAELAAYHEILSEPDK